MHDAPLRLFVSVPVACFRVGYAREYWETYPCPPPSTVYGMLLSLVGETNRLVHKGAELALAMLSEPQRSVILRTVWRVKKRHDGLGRGVNARPDFQEVLTDIRLSVWVRRGKEENKENTQTGFLADRVDRTFKNPARLARFGALALGESTHLVDEVRPWRPGDADRGRLLVRHEAGFLTLPVWPDHVGAQGTRWDRFDLQPVSSLLDAPADSAWVTISPP